MVPARVSAVLVILLITAAQGGTQDAPPAGQTPFRAGVNLVRVDAIVPDRSGNPLTDLTAADFEIIEDGKTQTTAQFRQVAADGRSSPADPPPREVRPREDA